MDNENSTAPWLAEEIAIISKDVDITDGYFLDNPDPTLLTEGRGKGLKLYDEIDRDAHSGSVLQTRYLAIAGEDWEMVASDETPRAKKIADFVTDALESCNLLQAVQELAQAILYGFYVGEVMWQEKDKMILPAKILVKHPRRFGFTKERELRLITKANPREGEEVPERKFIVFSYGASDNPYGKGLGQRLWWPLWFKKHGIKFWLIFLDKFGMPTGVGKYPPGAKPEEKKVLLEAVEAIHSETGVTIPENMIIELLEASRSGNVTYESLCQYMDLQISKAVLGQTLTTEVSGGSFAASKTHDEVRADIKDADCGLMAECFNNSIIPWIVDFNFAGVTEYPRFRYITEEEDVLKDKAERDEILVNKIGVQVDPAYFYTTYNLPQPTGGPSVIPPAGFTPAAASSSFADQVEKPGTMQTVIDRHAARLFETTDLGANEKRIVEAVKQSASFEEAMEKVLTLYPTMDMEPLRKNVELALLNGNLAGRMAVRNGA